MTPNIQEHLRPTNLITNPHHLKTTIESHAWLYIGNAFNPGNLGKRLTKLHTQIIRN